MAPEDSDRDVVPPLPAQPPVPPMEPEKPIPPETPTPPGTSATRLVESSGFKVAIVAWVQFFNMVFIFPWLTAKYGEGATIAFGVAEFSSLAALGIQVTDKSSLRWK